MDIAALLTFTLVLLLITVSMILRAQQLLQVTPNRSETIRYYIKEENDMGLVYEIAFDGTANHVFSRVIGYSIDGVYTEKTVPYSVTVLTLPPVKDGAVITAKIKDVDQAGNQSEWSDEISFTAKDTIPPAKPGAPLVKLLAEVDDEPAPPPVAPEPAPVNIVTGDTVLSPAHDD